MPAPPPPEPLTPDGVLVPDKMLVSDVDDVEVVLDGDDVDETRPTSSSWSAWTNHRSSSWCRDFRARHRESAPQGFNRVHQHARFSFPQRYCSCPQFWALGVRAKGICALTSESR